MAVGVVLSGLFAWLAARGVDWPSAAASLAQVDWTYVLLYVAAAFAIHCVRIGRWVWLVHALGERRLGRSIAVGSVGVAAVFFLPARLGELARPLLIADKEGLGFGEGVATVVAERLIDGLVVGLLLVGLGFWVGGTLSDAATIQSAGWTIGAIFLAVTFGAFVAARYAGAFSRLAKRLFGRWPALASRLTGAIAQFRVGLLALTRSHSLLVFVALTILLTLAAGGSIGLLFEAFGLELPLSAAFVVLGAQSVGVMIPAGPTALGTFHFAVIWAVGLYGVAGNAAFNLAVLFHLGQVAVYLLGGLFGIVAGGLEVRRLIRRLWSGDA